MVSKTAEGGVLAGQRSLVALVRVVPVELKEGVRKGLVSPKVDCKCCI